MFDYKEKFIRPKDSKAADEDIIAAWSKIEKKYGVKLFLKNDRPRPVTEFLDDLYIKLTPDEINSMMMDIMSQGHLLFSNLLKHSE